MQTEEWRQVVGYEGKYLVSNTGKVKSLLRNGKLLNHNDNGRGYLQVTLYFNSKRVTHNIHSLVAKAFLGARKDGMTVNHIDGNKYNNCLYNLEYCSQGDNSRHAIDTGLRVAAKGASNGNAKLEESDVIQIRQMLSQGMSQRTIASKFGVKHPAIGSIKRGLTWAHLT